MSPAKILITGARGLLGSEFVRALDTAIALGHEELDICERDSVWRSFERHSPQIVINTAAYTAVDRAESDRKAAHQLNVEGVQNLAAACAEFGTKLIHFSTDQVFDGQGETPWKEDSPTHPLNYYAQCKLESEQLVASLENSLCLRVQWLYGAKTPRFLHLADRKEFGAIVDQFGAPTWSRDVVRYTMALVQTEARGLFHLSYDDYGSWAEIFQFVKEWMDYDVILNAVTTDSLHLPAARPRFAVLSNQKLRATLEIDKIGSWKESLGEFLTLYK